MAKTKEGRPSNFPHNRDTFRALAERLREAARKLDETATQLSDVAGEAFIYVGSHSLVDDGASAVDLMVHDASKKIMQKKFSRLADVQQRSNKDVFEHRILPLIREGQAVHQADAVSTQKVPKPAANGSVRKFGR